jgi:hypothetical protein
VLRLDTADRSPLMACRRVGGWGLAGERMGAGVGQGRTKGRDTWQYAKAWGTGSPMYSGCWL